MALISCEQLVRPSDESQGLSQLHAHGPFDSCVKWPLLVLLCHPPHRILSELAS